MNADAPEPDETSETTDAATAADSGQRDAAAARREAVERAAQAWQDELMPLSGRNQLLYYRTLKLGTLELTDGDPDAMAALLKGRTVRLSKFALDRDGNGGRDGGDGAGGADGESVRRARAVYRKALEHREEKGIDTLFLALGMATWHSETSSATPQAPVLMCHADLNARGAAGRDFDVALRGEWSLNEALLTLLAAEFDVRTDAEELADAADSDLGTGSVGWGEAARIFEALERAAAEVGGFAVSERAVVGQFAYTKLPMVNDLADNIDLLAGHDLIAAIAGVPEASQTILGRSAGSAADPSQPDRTAPTDEYLVLDADSSQNSAINAALAGESFVIQGPPGTGKSQTIANLIAAMAASGRSVLFVAEKSAAIEAVLKRLHRVGLGDFVMDLHGAKNSKRETARQFARALDVIGSLPPQDLRGLHHELESARRELSEYAAAVNEAHEPWGVSVFDAQAALLGLGEAADTGLRIDRDDLVGLDAAVTLEVRERLARWAALDEPLRRGHSPWAGAQAQSADETAAAARGLSEAGAHLAELRRALAAGARELGISVPASAAASGRLMGLLSRIGDYEADGTQGVLSLGTAAAELATALEPGGRGVAARVFAQLFDGAYRRAKARVGEAVRGEGSSGEGGGDTSGATSSGRSISGPEALRAAQAAAQLVGDWREELRRTRNAGVDADGGIDSAGIGENIDNGDSDANTNGDDTDDADSDANTDSEDIHRTDTSAEAGAAVGATTVVTDRLQREASRKLAIAAGADCAGTDRSRREASRKQTGSAASAQEMHTALRTPSNFETLRAVWERFAEALAPVEALFDAGSGAGGDTGSGTDSGGVLAGLAFDDLAERLRALAADTATLYRLPSIHEDRCWLAEHHAGAVVAHVERADIAADKVQAAYDYARFDAIRREAVMHDPRLGSFDGALQRRRAEEFARADFEHIESTAKRVKRRIAVAAVETLNAHPEQERLVRAEAAKKTRHRPLRQLFSQAPETLCALQPCWAMSPLDVSQLLPPRRLFDLVIFDEASQVLPSDAVAALMRGANAVVAGDSRQLPPSTFFAASFDDDNEDEGDGDDGDDGGDGAIGPLGASAKAGYESILDVMDAALQRRMLQWHYRSADERLIAFSNRHIYADSLTTFPNAAEWECFAHVLVPHRAEAALDTRSNSDEVAAVVELMLEHARQRPAETLGVIAMGMHHANRIEGWLRERLAQLDDPAIEAFFDDHGEERAFVKNLERVQGDERDAIILSVGYAKGPAGNMRYMFGPLNQEGGERRLNVAVTRARQRMTVVSSFSHAEMDPERTRARGADLLRRYLRYAESGGTEPGGTAGLTPLNPFEIDVRDRLTAVGMSVVPQYGSSGYRIDFAVRHPTLPDRFALAVEADGATYHSGATARDRDRLRQEHLEALGWRFHRIWSTDWFNDPASETAKAVAAYQRAVAEIDAQQVMSTRRQQRRGPVPETPEPETTSDVSTGDATSAEASGADATTASPQASSADAATKPRRAMKRPSIEPGHPIARYSDDQLDRLAAWIASDGLLRTDDQMLHEMMTELGFKRRGSKIVARLSTAVRRQRQHRTR